MQMLTCTVAPPAFASSSGRTNLPSAAIGHGVRSAREWRLGRCAAGSQRNALRVRITLPALKCSVRRHRSVLIALPPTRALSSGDGEPHVGAPPPSAKKAKGGAGDSTRPAEGGVSASGADGSKKPAGETPRAAQGATQGQGQGQSVQKSGGQAPRSGGGAQSGSRANANASGSAGGSSASNKASNKPSGSPSSSNASGATNGTAKGSTKGSAGAAPARDKAESAAASSASGKAAANGAAAAARMTAAANAQEKAAKAAQAQETAAAGVGAASAASAASAPGEPGVAASGARAAASSPPPTPTPGVSVSRAEMLRQWDEEDRATMLGAAASMGIQGARNASGNSGAGQSSGSTKGGASPSSADGGSCMFSGSRGQALIRRLALLKNSGQVLEALEEWAASPEGRAVSKDCGGGMPEFSARDALVLMRGVLAAGNVDLALSIFQAMKAAGASKGYNPAAARTASSSSSPSSPLQPAVWRWPVPDLPLHEALVQGLAANCRVSDAIAVVNSLRRRGAMGGAEVHFGRVIACPNPACGKPLAVVQPQQGIQKAPCSCCQYEYELVSGKVVSSTSEAINVDETLLQKLVKFITKKTGVKAVHNVKIQTPDGQARTFRFGTASSSVPALESERITLAASASDAAKGAQFGRAARLPGTSPSEPLVATNHSSGAVTRLMPPPPTPGSSGGFPSAVLQRAVVIVPLAAAVLGTDALNAFIDPTIPRAVAAGTLVLVAAGVVGNTVVLPQMNKLLPGTVGRYVIRQALLEKHDQLEARLKDLTDAIAEEIRMVARLFQLQTKMEAVGQQGVYSARIERVKAARAGLEQRMVAKLDLVDKYATIANMIEIEVEMDSDLATAELKGAAVGGVVDAWAHVWLLTRAPQ
eukprot:jgi/Mesvir1/4602/Mv15827-RA.2